MDLRRGGHAGRGHRRSGHRGPFERHRPRRAAPPPARPSASASPRPNIPAGWTEHDIDARNVVRRYIGNLAPALKDIYGDAVVRQARRHPRRGGQLPRAVGRSRRSPRFPSSSSTTSLTPLTPELDGDVKVFELTIDEIEQKIDEMKAPVAALGYNKQWPGPTIRVTEGDKVRAIFTNNLNETTGVHFHGVEFDDFFQDGVPFVTQKPITPGRDVHLRVHGEPAGSLMYHSHHNATDQVGRGLLGAFIVDPKSRPR